MIDSFLINNVEAAKDKSITGCKFNEYFTEIGLELAAKISRPRRLRELINV